MITKTFFANLIFILCLFSPNISFSQTDHHQLTDPSLFHQNNPVLTAVVPASFPPFYYTDEEGLPYGMAIEVLNELDHHAGFLTNYIVKKSWADVFKAINSGEAQVIPNLGITEERKKHYFFTQAYARTDINVFTRTGSNIDSAGEIINLPAGVIKNNVGVKIANKFNLKNSHIYDSIDLAFTALLNNEIDIIIYPKLITLKAANRFNKKHLIRDSGITLKTIHRAIAVSKKYPEIFKKLNTALDDYLQTQDYKDTYVAWYGKEAHFFTKTNLIVINLFVLTFTILFFNFFWRKRNFSIFNNGNGKNINAIWVVTLISILISATSIVTLSTLWILYETSFNKQRLRLIDNLKSRARLIEAITRYNIEDQKHHAHSTAGANAMTLAQIIDAHKNFHGFGETGEFTLARKNKDVIEFVLRQRHSSSEAPQPVSFNSDLAIPMRMALQGHSGTIMGKDYRGENVLAAYEPVKILNLGIVAKIDLAELRDPFIRSALYILTIVILISLLGSLLFFYIILPVIRRIKDTEQRFHQLFLNNYTPALLINANNAKIIDANKAAIKFYGYNQDELISYKLNILCPEPTSNILEQLQQVQKSKNKSLTTQHRLQNGNVRDVEILMSLVEINNVAVIYCTIIDITNKLKKEKKHARLKKILNKHVRWKHLVSLQVVLRTILTICSVLLWAIPNYPLRNYLMILIVKSPDTWSKSPQRHSVLKS